MKFECIGKEDREEVLLKLLSLCKKYKGLYPDRMQWGCLHGYHSGDIFLLEKLVAVINHRFFKELQELYPQEESLCKIVERDFSLQLYGKDFYHTSPGSREYSIPEYGDDFLYFMESSCQGLTLPEDMDGFSFLESFDASLGYYSLEEHEELLHVTQDPYREMMESFFPDVLKEDPGILSYGRGLMEKMQSVLDYEEDHYFTLYRSKKLRSFFHWYCLKNHKEFPECKELMELYKIWIHPMECNDNHGITCQSFCTENYCYLWFHYYFDSNYQCNVDGKFLYPPHFYVSFAMELLLKIIEIKYNTSFPVK